MKMNIDGQLEVNFNPSGFRQLNVRTESKARGISTKAQAEWWMIGKPRLSPHCQFEEKGKIRNKNLLPFLKKNIYLNLHMCRYNESANIGTLRGYIQATDLALNSPELQGWRLVPLQSEIKEDKTLGTKNTRYAKFFPVKKGFLVDLLNAVCDKNTEEFKPLYPVKSILEVMWGGQKRLEEAFDLESIQSQSGGVLFFPMFLPDGVPIEARITEIF